MDTGKQVLKLTEEIRSNIKGIDDDLNALHMKLSGESKELSIEVRNKLKDSCKELNHNLKEIYDKFQKVSNDLKEKPSSLKEVIKEIYNSVGDVSYKTWFKYPMENSFIEDDILYLPCKNEFHKLILENKYLNVIKENIKLKVNFIVVEEIS